MTTASADYAKNIQSFVDQSFDVIVTVGFALGNDTTIAAKANPDIRFIGVDQGRSASTRRALPIATFTCAGSAATLLPNYRDSFKEHQPGYLAGIVAASMSKSGRIAAIGGTKVFAGPASGTSPGYQIGAPR